MTFNLSIIGERSATMDEIDQQVKIIIDQFNPLQIILFGSYAWGEPSPESDVDLLVIVDSDRSANKLAFEISMALSHAFPMDLVVKTKAEVQRRKAFGDYFIRNILERGKILYERAGERMD